MGVPCAPMLTSAAPTWGWGGGGGGTGPRCSPPKSTTDTVGLEKAKAPNPGWSINEIEDPGAMVGRV